MKKNPSSISLAVSACLLGHAVRYDGGHKRQAFLLDELSQIATLIPFCPETAIGLPTPRPPIRLVSEHNLIRVLGVENPSLDFTQALQEYGTQMAAQFAHINGLIIKRGSPSCGSQRVKVYNTSSKETERNGMGLFTQTLLAHLPHLPVIDEEQLNDPEQRQHFLKQLHTNKN
ncbi:MAG: DUF523 domain-containing protein [Gammaproteobacteria bacterium]|nr:DUF523 domain-containing protein [Gammaproteobacteria bacterium]